MGNLPHHGRPYSLQSNDAARPDVRSEETKQRHPGAIASDANGIEPPSPTPIAAQ